MLANARFLTLRGRNIICREASCPGVTDGADKLITFHSHLYSPPIVSARPSSKPVHSAAEFLRGKILLRLAEEIGAISRINRADRPVAV